MQGNTHAALPMNVPYFVLANPNFVASLACRFPNADRVCLQQRSHTAKSHTACLCNDRNKKIRGDMRPWPFKAFEESNKRITELCLEHVRTFLSAFIIECQPTQSVLPGVDSFPGIKKLYDQSVGNVEEDGHVCQLSGPRHRRYFSGMCRGRLRGVAVLNIYADMNRTDIILCTHLRRIVEVGFDL
eukprot:1137710-Pelagomonas_calceolata.AAC.7